MLTSSRCGRDLGRVGAGVVRVGQPLDQRLRQPRARRTPPGAPGRAQHVEADPADHRGQPGRAARGSRPGRRWRSAATPPGPRPRPRPSCRASGRRRRSAAPARPRRPVGVAVALVRRAACVDPPATPWRRRRRAPLADGQGSVVRDATGRCGSYDLQVSASEPEHDVSWSPRRAGSASCCARRAPPGHRLTARYRSTRAPRPACPTSCRPALAGARPGRRRRWPGSAVLLRRLPGAPVRDGRRPAPVGAGCCSCCRRWTAAARTARSRSVVGAMNPLGRAHQGVRAADRGGAAHHFLWRIAAGAAAGRVRRASSTGRTTRTCWWRGCARSCPKRCGRRRYDEINSFERRWSRWSDDGQGDAAHLATRSSASGCWPGWTIRPSGGSSTRPISTTGPLGTSTSRRTTTRWTGAARRTRPWYVVPADRKWYRNWAVANLLLAHLDDMALDLSRGRPRHRTLTAALAATRARPTRRRQRETNAR